jgi:zinc protease
MALTGDVGTMEQYHQRLSSVTPEDVARVARTYLVPARRDTITLAQADHAAADAVHVGPNRGAQAAPAGPASPPGPATHRPPSPGGTPTTTRPRRPLHFLPERHTDFPTSVRSGGSR